MALSVASGRFAHDFFKCAAHSITVGETAFVSNLSNREAGVDKKVCCCVRSYINKILSESEKALNFLERLDSLILKSSAVAAIVMSL